MKYQDSHEILSKIMKKVFEKTNTVGAIIISGSEKNIYCEKSFGNVHTTSQSPVTNSTYFDIQSISKVVATVSLLEEFLHLGLMNLNDRVQKYLPEFHKNEIANIKVLDLVLHQSGISDEDFCKDYYTSEELWHEMFQAPIRFMTGSSVEYTDVGYRLLGLCLERVGGANLDTLSKRHVWQRIGMLNTTYDISQISKDCIAGFGESWGVVDDAQDRLLAKPLGCDGVFTTGTDLVIFCRHWLSRLKNDAFFLKLKQNNAGKLNNEWSFYESLGVGRKLFGWEQHDYNQSYIGGLKSEMTLEKAGGAGAFICIRPEKQDFFIYLTNHGRPDPFTMESWNQLVSNLRVREIALQVMKP